MTLIPCKCGQRPTLTEREHSGIRIIRIECECGKRGACLMYTKVEDADKMRQAAADGWNLTG